ncbi:MAG: hypothetical protein KDA77_07105, partial [Planctomycetaceae bacterium]|nr:hypothetical protein [Planctomycetaceae bacterium]
MRNSMTINVGSVIALVSVLCIAVSSFAEPPVAEQKKTSPELKPVSETKAAEKRPTSKRLVTVEEARQRAKLTHNIYATTLDAMHHHYFFHDRANVPARVMED